jgi:hypothetical protein
MSTSENSACQNHKNDLNLCSTSAAAEEKSSVGMLVERLPYKII